MTALTAMTACGSRPQPDPGNYVLIALTSGTTAGLRGVSVVDAGTVWASGARGTVLRTVDGGATWSTYRIAGADSLDFRDVEAFDSITAYVLSAGEDGRIYKTADGGRNWALQFQNKTKGAFFDCFDFWDSKRGIAMSDPVDGRYLLLRTVDGATWLPIVSTAAPAALPGEAAFAASGSCLVTTTHLRAYLATGGGAQARVFMTADGGDTWTPVPTPVAAGTSSAGIFSLAFSDQRHGLAAGGDYQKAAAESVVAVTDDAGRTWRAAGRTAYVSGAAAADRSSVLVVVGTKGTRISRDAGATWATIDTLEYNAVQLAADGTGYAVGPRGRIGRLVRR